MKFNMLSVDLDWITSYRQQEELLVFLLPLISTHKNITTAYWHDAIYPHFPHGYDEYNLINIDHHHDISYDKDNKSLNQGNWIYHLCNIFNKKINYTWISNPNSEHPFPDTITNLKSFSFDHNLDYIKERKFDKIFICCSASAALTHIEVITTYKILERIIGKL